MRRTLSIIGCGNVGKTLARLWAENHSAVITQILNKSFFSAEEAVSFVGAGQAISSYDQILPVDIYMIGVPDDQIAICAARLAATGLLSPGKIIFHCSGSLPSSVMQAAVDQGAFMASVHPIRSFASPEQVLTSFAGTWCGMEGDLPALEVLSELYRSIGAELVTIDPESKMLYHAAAVFASNYVVTLLDVALEAYAKAGIPRNIGLQLIAPLIRKTTENILALGPEQSLSGPIARGDMETVDKQLQAVQAWDEKCGQLYKDLAARTIDLAKRRTK